eukprot:gene5403-10805_t
MGGFPSIITCSYRNVTKPQNILAFGSLGDLDRFLLLLFENISREEVLHNILENHAALQTLLEFMSSTISEQVEMTHNTSNDVHENLNTSDVENIIRKALVSKYSSKIFSLEGNFVSSESLAIFGHVLEAFPNYLKSEFYYKWRSIETFDSIKAVFNNKDDLLETTLPDLQRSIYDSIYNKADAYILTKTLFNDILPVNDASPSTATFSENNVQRCSIAYQIEVEDEPIERNYSTIIEQTLDHCDPIEVSTLLRSKSWLPIFLAMAETLPIGSLNLKHLPKFKNYKLKTSLAEPQISNHQFKANSKTLWPEPQRTNEKKFISLCTILISRISSAKKSRKTWIFILEMLGAHAKDLCVFEIQNQRPFYMHSKRTMLTANPSIIGTYR